MKVFWASRRLLRANFASENVTWGSCKQLAAESLNGRIESASAADVIPEIHDESSRPVSSIAAHDATAASPHGCSFSSAQHLHNRDPSGTRHASAASQQLLHLWSAPYRSRTLFDRSIQPSQLYSRHWASSGLPSCIRGLSTETIQDRVSQANSILQVSQVNCRGTAYATQVAHVLKALQGRCACFCCKHNVAIGCHLHLQALPLLCSSLAMDVGTEFESERNAHSRACAVLPVSYTQ